MAKYQVTPPSAASTAAITTSIAVALLLGARESNMALTPPSQGQYYQKTVLLTGRISGENGYVDETPKQTGPHLRPFRKTANLQVTGIVILVIVVVLVLWYFARLP